MSLPVVIGIVRSYEKVARSNGILVVDSDVEFRYPDLGTLDDEISIIPGLRATADRI